MPRFRTVVLSAVIVLSGCIDAVARQRADTVVVQLEPIVVEAERHQQVLSDATSAIGVIELDATTGLAVDSPTDLFSVIPGLGFLSLDGTGHDAQAVVRGFFGGGDAEYVQVLVDGVPLNDIETGLVPWDLIDLQRIARVEVLRGGSSSLYGDAAIGGVMNLYSAPVVGRRMTGSIAYGSNASIDAAARFEDVVGSRAMSIGGMVDISDGYRDRGAREVIAFSADVDLTPAAPVDTRVKVWTSWRDVEKPGPLNDSLLSASRAAILPMFKHDRTDERRHSASLLVRSRPGGAVDWQVRARGALRDGTDISTLALAADFADTQERDLNTSSAGLEARATAVGEPGRVVVGADVSRSSLESTYYAFFTGSSADYAAAGSVSRGDRLVAGEGDRTQLGAYVQLESRRLGPVSVTAGGRVDRIADFYSPETEPDIKNTHDAFSPKVGVNIAAVSTPSSKINLYASAGKSFKAPAIDQLFDQRLTPVPFPPFAVSISNGELSPQRGDNVEVGAYAQFLVPGRGRVEATAIGYRMDMRDELDFSFEEFRLINIGKSRHEGVEVGAKYFDRAGITAFANYALQSTTFRNGDNEGNFVKAIPRDLIDAGLSYAHRSGVGAGIRYSGARRMFLDDQNTRRLGDTGIVDAQVSFRHRGARATVEVFNVFDTKSVSTGYPDPAGGPDAFLFPNAERAIRLGVVYSR